jgi:hypothetical protein
MQHEKNDEFAAGTAGETGSESASQAKHSCGSAHCMCGGSGPKLTQMLSMMMPHGDAGDHFRKARLEFLKGVRAMIDQRIESMSHTEERRGTKLDVE